MKREGWFQSGVTLIELMLAATLIGTLGLAFASVYMAAHRYMVQGSAIVSSQSDNAYAMDHIKRRIFAANRVVGYADVYGDQRVAFRYDPNPLPGTPGDFSDDVWAGYRVDWSASPSSNYDNTFRFYSNIKTGETPPTAAEFDGTPNEVVARHVLATPPAVLIVPPLPPIFVVLSPSLVKVDLYVKHTMGADQYETHLTTRLSTKAGADDT